MDSSDRMVVTISIRMSKLDEREMNFRNGLRQHTIKRDVSAYLRDSVAAACINSRVILLFMLPDRIDYNRPTEAIYR